MGSRLVLCVLVMLAACARRPPRPAPLAITPGSEREYQVREVSLENGGVAVRLEIPSAPAGPKPAIFANLNEAPAMRADGVVVVTYTINWMLLKDAPPPPPKDADAQAGKWVLASSSPGTIGKQYLEQIAYTATRVIPRIIDYLEAQPEIDGSRLAITGASTTGFVALQALAADRRLDLATVAAACGDYHRFMRYSSMGTEGAPLRLDPAYDRWLREQEVIEHPRRVVHAALLMVNRTQDALVPIACADETDRVLARAYAASGRRDRYRYVRITDAEGHGLGPRESEENIAWLRRWLLEGR
jgi:hypothetical protein